MVILDPEIKKLVHEYDITFDNGLTVPVTIDSSAGDTYQETDSNLLIYLAAKPSKTNKNLILPAENIKIFKQKVLLIQDREREVTQLTPEQQAAWDQTLVDVGLATRH